MTFVFQMGVTDYLFNNIAIQLKDLKNKNREEYDYMFYKSSPPKKKKPVLLPATSFFSTYFLKNFDIVSSFEMRNHPCSADNTSSLFSLEGNICNRATLMEPNTILSDHKCLPF